MQHGRNQHRQCWSHHLDRCPNVNNETGRQSTKPECLDDNGEYIDQHAYTIRKTSQEINLSPTSSLTSLGEKLASDKRPCETIKEKSETSQNQHPSPQPLPSREMQNLVSLAAMSKTFVTLVVHWQKNTSWPQSLNSRDPQPLASS